MITTDGLKKEMMQRPSGTCFSGYFRAMGYENGTRTTPAGRRADGIVALLTEPNAWIYKNDLIAGSFCSLFTEMTPEEFQHAQDVCAPYGERWFGTNSDHYSPDFVTPLTYGISGMIGLIGDSKKAHRDEPDRVDFLDSMQATLEALQVRIRKHADLAEELKGTEGYDDERLAFIAKNCRQLADGKPETFAQALQLVWMIHTSFLFEGRYAMALGRMDQYLYPFFRADIDNGTLNAESALELVENTLVKICERRAFFGGDDVVNICIAGVDADGENATNELSYIVLAAVGNINNPGPNLSARISPKTPDNFLDACLKVIGTGLGYPALMNDDVNRAALRRYGYDEKDVNNFSMVGCIENLITGCQPPWSDGRFDTPRFIEYVLHNGEGLEPSAKGLNTGDVSEITSMDEFMKRLETQLEKGARDYVNGFNSYNDIKDPENYTQPFLSCFCQNCIERGLDINMGGAKYPSVHGAALMGVGTTADSLAAIEKVVFVDKEATMAEIAEATKNNFEGYEALREKLLAAPKYGNNDDFVDKYAVWFVNFLNDEFDKYKTRDGGGFYTAMAANTSNIYAGMAIGATPDGRLAKEPLSDAASPTYGRDTHGATTTVLSVTKPDYTRVACGTVVNQKFSPSMFSDEKRPKLLTLIRTYFARGGQEMQINSTSPEVLRAAMDKPEDYQSLVVRVSGFSAFYVTLGREVQLDILHRTQHE